MVGLLALLAVSLVLPNFAPSTVFAAGRELQSRAEMKSVLNSDYLSFLPYDLRHDGRVSRPASPSAAAMTLNMVSLCVLCLQIMACNQLGTTHVFMLFSVIPEEKQKEIISFASGFDEAVIVSEVFRVRWPHFVKCLTIFLANHESFAHSVKVPKDWVHKGVVEWLEGLDGATYCDKTLEDPKEYRACTPLALTNNYLHLRPQPPDGGTPGLPQPVGVDRLRLWYSTWTAAIGRPCPKDVVTTTRRKTPGC
eukprot:scaffold1518_cov417-Prasinococcus_capsulatus_cf.AAC.12